MDTGLQGKVALVTGSGRGIGKAIALGLAKEGVDIAVNCRVNIDSAEETAKEIRSLGRRAMVTVADVTDESAVKKMVQQIVKEWSTIDILVNNAGVSFVALVEDMAKSDWDRLLNIMAGGTFLCAKAVIPVMKKRGGGKIINISSVAGERTTQNSSANYVAAKAAILGFTRQLAYELGPYHINVNAVCPWTVVTPLSLSQVGKEELERIRQGIPLGDYPKPEDVADAVVFLASDQARLITGYSIRIDGGMCLPVGTRPWDEYVRSHKEAVKKAK
ncbi:MAG: SDR family oxidoreductase [Chloroflexi bacterium]|nr:SDR family oxidoreductase [Chloroflexota bacterium]